jgi:EmrB/QacA subfamily drug resistance transporter
MGVPAAETRSPAPASAADGDPPAPGPAETPAVSTAHFLQLFSAVMVPMFLAVADQTLLATATPRIALELGGLRDTTWIALGYMMSITVTAPLYGRLGDRYGRRDMLLVAMLLFAAGSLACALAPGMLALVAGRVLQGLGGGGLIVLSQALVGELVPPRQRGRFQGYFATNFSLASIGGPIIGGLVVHHGSWRWLFYANLPLCLLAAWRLRRLPQQHSLAPRPISDLGGALLFAVAATLGLLWVSFAGHRFAWVSPTSALLLGTTLALGWALLRRERTHAEPFLPVELLRNPSIRGMALTVVCFGAAMFSLVFFLPIFLQLGRGHDARAAGLLLLPVTLGIVAGSTLTGRLISRFGHPTRLPAAGLALAGCSLLALALLPLQPALLGGLGFACGVGLGSVMPTAQIVVQWLAGREALGAATSIVSLSRATGSALGTACFGAVVFALLPDIPLETLAEGARQGPLAIASAADLARIGLAFRVGFGGAGFVALLGALAAARIRPVGF